MTISGISTTSAAAPERAPDKTLDMACREFEGMLLGSILKQGIIHQPDEEEEQGNNSMLTEFAAEQTARALSNTGVTGIADLLQRQMRTPRG